jgi:hypothetical protein
VDLSDAAWRTSSYSGGNGGQCVEVAAVTDPENDPARECAIRDSRDPAGPVLAFTPRQWLLFTDRMKAGQPGPD